MEPTKVSVLTTVYDTPIEYLAACIESILSQSFKDFEFIILNNGSTKPEIETLIKGYEDKRIKYIKLSKNIGVVGARNKLLDLACGEYLAICDSDDISYQNRLEIQVKYLDEHHDVGVVSGWYECFGYSNKVIKTLENNHDIKVNLMMHCTIAQPAAMLRKSVLLHNNIRYDPRFDFTEDYKMWCDLIDVTRFHNLQQVLIKYRCHESTTSINTQICLDNTTEIRGLVQNTHISYYKEYLLKEAANNTCFKLKFLNMITIIKQRKNWICLFGFIPMFKINKYGVDL